MFRQIMAHQTVTAPATPRFDWKGLGYLVSIVSVFFLGAVAWPRPSEPAWHLAALSAGRITSIAGRGCRYTAHLDQQRDRRRTAADASRRRHGR